MKKLSLIVLAVLILLGVCTPFINGIVTEKMVRKAQHDINEMYTSMGSGLHIDIVRYDRGFYSSEIEWKVNLGTLKSVYGIDEIMVIERAKHGFFSVVSQSSFENNKPFTRFIETKFGGTNPLTITTRYNLFGDITSTISVARCSLKDKGKTIDIQPAQIVTVIGKDIRHLSSKLHWDGLAVDKEFSMEGISADYDLEKISTYIWDGTVTYSIKAIKGIEQNAQFTLEDFKGTYNLDYDKKAKTIASGMSFGFASLAADQESIENGFIRLGVKNLNAQGYEDLMSLYAQTIYNELDELTAAEEDPEAMQELLRQQMTEKGAQLIAIVETLLKKDLEFSISDLRATLPLGTITGDFLLRLNKDLTIAEFSALSRQPDQAFRAFSIASNLSFPAELARNNAMLVSPLTPGMKTGFFVKKGDQLTHHATTRDGKLILNDEEVELR